MSDQILEKIQVVVCHGPHNYLLEEVGVPLRRESYLTRAAGGGYGTARAGDDVKTSSTMKLKERLRRPPNSSTIRLASPRTCSSDSSTPTRRTSPVCPAVWCVPTRQRVEVARLVIDDEDVDSLVHARGCT